MSTLQSSKYERTVYFTKEVDSDYECAICFNVADEPMNCGSQAGCTGVFCTKCMSNALIRKMQCSVCRFTIKDKPIRNNILKGIINKQEVYCIYTLNPHNKRTKRGRAIDKGCQWKGLLRDMDSHINNDCQNHKTECIHCEEDVLACKMTEHLAECDEVIIECDDCQASFRRYDKAYHSGICPNKIVLCPFACHGCTVKVTRALYTAHQTNYAIEHAELLSTRLSIIDKQYKRTIYWTITNIQHILINNKDTIFSKNFILNDGDGISSFYLSTYIDNTDYLRLYITKDEEESTSILISDLTGSIFTLVHTTDATKNVTKTLKNGSVKLGKCIGWSSFCKDITPYITKEDTIVIEAKISFRPQDISYTV